MGAITRSGASVSFECVYGRDEEERAPKGWLRLQAGSKKPHQDVMGKPPHSTHCYMPCASTETTPGLGIEHPGTPMSADLETLLLLQARECAYGAQRPCQGISRTLKDTKLATPKCHLRKFSRQHVCSRTRALSAGHAWW